MSRLNHHEQALSLSGCAITIAPAVTIAAQAAVAALKRRKRRMK